MTAVMSIALIPGIASKKQVNAYYGKSQVNTRMGVNQMSSPRKPTSKDDPWMGSFVYYGVNGDLYRVLDTSSTRFGGFTLFLDSDEVVCGARFDPQSNVWTDSEIKDELEKYAQKAFTPREYNAIACSKAASVSFISPDEFYNSRFKTYVALTGEKLFLLDADDVTNPNLGYWQYTSNGESNTIANRYKSLEYDGWWLRTPDKEDTTGSYVGYVTDSGKVDTHVVTSKRIGMAPALNIDKKSILFSTAVSGNYGDLGAKYKLTLFDENMKISIRDGEKCEKNGRRVTVPYSISGSNSDQVNRVSVLILSNKYKPTNITNILYYQQLDKNSSGNGAFTLPETLDFNKWGISYYVYIVAETVNDHVSTRLTDYASELLEISIPKEVEIDLTHGGLTGQYWDISTFGVLGNLGLVGIEYQQGNDYQDADLDKDGNMDIRVNWTGQMYMERLNTCSVYGKLTFSSDELMENGYKSITFLFPLSSCSIQSAVPAGKNKVKLTWGAVEGAEGYLIYAQKNGKYAYCGMTTSGTTFTDTKALDTDYNFYWVFAYYKNGEKMLPGGCVKYVYAKGVCAAVTNLKASSQTGSVKLSWTASSGADGYLVYGIRPGGSYGYIGMTTQGTTYTDKKASKTDYTFYWVFPYHKNGDQMIVGGTAKYTYGKAK